MAGEKRKRREEESQDLPRKKKASSGPRQSIQVSMIEDSDLLAPVIASSPGLVLPQDIVLKPYTKPRSSAARHTSAGPELLLRSSTHPKLDYTASEERSNGSDAHLRHYVGVYDPETGELQLVQARNVVLRSTLRSANATGEEEKQKDPQTPYNYLSARNNLGLAFGSKKSQKAIRALTANAIKASPTKSATQDSPDKRSQLDPLASAVVLSMADTASDMPTREQMQADIDEGKPRPKPNLQATTPAEVYPIEQLVGGANTLANMGVKDWIDKVQDGKGVELKSRFVARRLAVNVQRGDVKKLKVLRYLLLLIEWSLGLETVPKRGKKVPKLEKMGALVESYGSEVVAGVARRFADGFQLSRWHLDNLTTHTFAIAITLDNFTMDTHDLREDLKLEQKEINKYFKEIGCVVAKPTEVQQRALGILKAEALNHSIAQLKIPLTFPKTRIMPVKKRGR
ncbi:DNA-directed RNA polymerase I subunit rpa49 [Lecanora helva]